MLAAARAGDPARRIEIAVNLSVRALEDPELAAWLQRWVIVDDGSCRKYPWM